MSFPFMRRKMRLRGHDYTQAGAYFVTINLRERRSLFGTVGDGHVELSDVGCMIAEVWEGLPERYPTIVLDAFIVMPDHVHGVLFMNDGVQIDGSPHLSEVIRVFKSITTTRYITGVKQAGWPRFVAPFWQANYYDHVIRDDRDLDARRVYIERNPGRWEERRASLRLPRS